MTWWQQLLQILLHASLLMTAIGLALEQHYIAGFIVLAVEQCMEVSWPERSPVDKPDRAVHDGPQQQDHP